jgi:hypothetical protein
VVAVSISVRLPELPDARMDTRMPISVSPRSKNEWEDDGRARSVRQYEIAKDINGSL